MEASQLEQAGGQPSDAQASAADAHRQQVVREAVAEGAVLTPASTSPPAELRRRRAALVRILRFGVSDGAKSSSGDALAMSELETELALLREENARLKVERHRPADVGHVIERMRSIRQEIPAAQGEGGQREGESSGAVDTTRAIEDECLVVRESLMDACEEVQRAMQGIRGRLETLTGEIHGRADDRGMPERLAAPVVEALDMESGDLGKDSSELAQSVA